MKRSDTSITKLFKNNVSAMNRRNVVMGIISVFVLLCCILSLKTLIDVSPVSTSLTSIISDVRKLQVLDRHGISIAVTYQNSWNTYDYIPLHEIPEFLQHAFVAAEDKRFFKHNGVDWLARLHALWQNIRSLHTIRGASTITEQVIRMINDRPRTLWARWLEGIEANHLEKKSSKANILEFYLNQVPYAENRRGIVQAARYYFNRDLDTLNRKEMLALAVLVRAPSYLDLYNNTERILPSIEHLSERLMDSGILTDEEYRQISNEDFQLAKPTLPVYAGHFVNYVRSTIPRNGIRHRHKLHTTLDSSIQNVVQDLLDQRLNSLRNRHVMNGAALVVDHTNNEVLAWVNRGKGDANNIHGALIDAVTSLRQPGSSLKPFLYAMALESGWTPATLLDDSPLAKPVGYGLHPYRNYSRLFYGPVSLREALGNSLNIPAIRTIQFVGVGNYLSLLRRLGFENLVQHPDYYGAGLALGNGEVQLFELVQAYTILANHGVFSPLRVLQDRQLPYESERIFSEEVATLIAHILSDSSARNLEFGSGNLLSFPVQTAVKTGTSNDYRDAWAVGFNYHYTAGIWMGNLDGSSMDGVTGSIGPAMVLRSIFAELNKFEETRPLYLSPNLIKREICDPSIKVRDGDCLHRTEWFIAGTEPETESHEHLEEGIKLVRPTHGLQMAMDPRIPDDQEAFEFFITGIRLNDMVEWEIDTNPSEKTRGGSYIWPVKRGIHTVQATVWRNKDKIFQSDKISFYVK
jgi:penicillin-binding protein 1C